MQTINLELYSICSFVEVHHEATKQPKASILVKLRNDWCHTGGGGGVCLSSSSIYGGFYLKVLIFQMPKGQSGRSSCRRGWIWTGPSGRAPPSLRSSSTGWRWSSRGVSMWSAGNARNSHVSSICPKLRYQVASLLCFHCIFFFLK